MTDKIFLDTNILIYSIDSSDKTKQKIAQELMSSFFSNQGEFVISTQVISEFCSVILKKFTYIIKESDLKNLINTFSEEQIYINDKNTILKCLDLKIRYGFSYWDSMIVATAIQSGCDILYSEDMSDGQVVENLRIINPFK